MRKTDEDFWENTVTTLYSVPHTLARTCSRETVSLFTTAPKTHLHSLTKPKLSRHAAPL